MARGWSDGGSGGRGGEGLGGRRQVASYASAPIRLTPKLAPHVGGVDPHARPRHPR